MTTLRRTPVALAILVAAGVVLRVVLSLTYTPPVLGLADSGVYIDMAANHLFSDPTRVVGYSILLRGLHALWGNVEFTLFVQGLAGIATGLLLYACLRRIEAPRWAALLPAAAVLLSLDQIFLEHALMPETFFTLALVATLYAGIGALDEPRPIRGPITTRIAWLAAAGALLGLSAWIRPVTFPLAPFLAIWLLFALSGGWKAKLVGAAISLVAAAVVVLSYFALNDHYTGYFGFSPSSGWGLYSRTAPFADCSKFDTPAGTARLCERSAASTRPGPDFYGWETGSPARDAFGGPPAGNGQLGAFARQAIEHQPLGYAKAIVRDMARYFVPVTVPGYFGVGYELIDIDRRAPGFEPTMLDQIDSYYSGAGTTIHGGVEQLADLQRHTSVRRTLLTIALVLGLAGLVLTRGRARSTLFLLLGASLLAMLVPIATAIFSARYAVPVTGPLVGAGAIGAWALFDRIRATRRDRGGAGGGAGPSAESLPQRPASE